MTNLKFFLAPLMFLVFSSCSEKKLPEIVQKTDTLVTLWNTDSCNYRKLTFILGDYEQGFELQSIKDSDFIPYSKTMFGYDEMMNKNLIINSLYDTNLCKFLHFSKQEIVYDKLKNPIQTVNYIDKNNVWITVSKVINRYDKKKNVTCCELYNYGNNKFYPVSKTKYSYDAHNNLTETIEYLSDSTEKWIRKSKVENEFTDNLLKFVYTFIPVKDTSWNLVSKVEHSYDIASKRVSSTSYISNGAKGKWIYNVRTEYEYDTLTGKMTNAHTFFWNEKKKIWKSEGTEDF